MNTKDQAIVRDIVREALAGALADLLPRVNPERGKASDTWRNKAQREQGEGFACTADPPCSRHDLRTPKYAASHVLPNGHVAR